MGANGLAAISNTLQIAADEQTQAIQRNLLHQLKQDFIQVVASLNDEVNGVSNQQSPEVDKVIPSKNVTPGHPYVLIVDDDRSTRLSLKGCLEQDNYYIEEAANGAIALAKCEQKCPI